MVARMWSSAVPFLRVAISIVLVLLFVRSIGIPALTIDVSQWSLRWFFLAVCSAAISWCLAAQKWRLVIPRENRFGFLPALKLVLVSISYGYLLPGSQVTGEIAKYAHARNTQPASERKPIIYSIITDKVYGLAALIIIGYMGTLFSASIPSQVSKILFFLAAASFGVLCLFIIVKKFFKHAPIVSRIMNYRAGLPPVKPTEHAGSAILSLIYQFAIVLTVWLLARSVGADAAFTEFLWIVGATALFTSLPISYAGIGVREITIAYSFNLVGIPSEQIVAFTAAFYALMAIPVAIGCVLIMRDFAKKTRNAIA